MNHWGNSSEMAHMEQSWSSPCCIVHVKLRKSSSESARKNERSLLQYCYGKSSINYGLVSWQHYGIFSFQQKSDLENAD